MVICPSCKNENKDGTKICAYCGTLIDPTQAVSTRSLGENEDDGSGGVPKWGSARFNSRTNLIIGVEGEPRTLLFDADEIHELIIGRKDPHSGESPEIDLDQFQGLEKGVSRRHAAIIHKDGSLNVVDIGSANGTFLNGQKLVPNQPRVLRDGDDIRLGKLVLRVTFERA